jgi:hypothetical protein
MLGSGIIIRGYALITRLTVVKDNRRKKEMPRTVVAQKIAKKKKKNFLGGMNMKGGLSHIREQRLSNPQRLSWALRRPLIPQPFKRAFP